MFGPNSDAVKELFVSVRDIFLYHHVGERVKDASTVEFVDFAFFAENRADLLAPWSGAMSGAEAPLERLVFESSRMPAWDRMRSHVFAQGARIHGTPGESLDDFYLELDEKYVDDSGYYPGTMSYPHEIYGDFFKRIVFGAATEVFVDDLDSGHVFFRNALEWFRQGHVPCGWRGQWPEGTLLVW